jgi:AbiTii
VSLLREIQTALLGGEAIGPILLKLRFLASRLGSDVLEEWIKHEAEGYPPDVEVPDYRKIGVSYSGTFSGGFGAAIRNAPIPPYLVEKYAGEQWTRYEVRQSIAAVDGLIATGDDSGTLQINAQNLILILQGKVYEDLACNSIVGTIGKTSLVEIQNAVRNRVLELTLQIEKSVPIATDITLGPPPENQTGKERELVTQITNQIIHGNVTSITNTGENANIQVNITQGNKDQLIESLMKSGLPEADAAELAKILASEQPESRQEPFGKKAKAWIAKNIVKAANGTWKVGMAVVTQVLTEAALKFYGLK